MNTSLEHLPEHKQKQLREITGIIVKAVDPEKVILFGSHATGRWVEHRYTEGGITYEYISDYDILVITKSGESRKDYEVQDLIENRCFYRTPVTVNTHDIDFVNKMLCEGQYLYDLSMGAKNRDYSNTEFWTTKRIYDDAVQFGNFNAGYTGTYAGVSSMRQYTYAGMGEIAKHRSIEDVIWRTAEIEIGLAPYGDEPNDYIWNTAGMRAAKDNE